MAAGIGLLASSQAHATVFDYQMTINSISTVYSGSPIPEATTTFHLSGPTNPSTPTINPGDTIQEDFLAPAGHFIEITTPTGATSNQLFYVTGNTNAVGGTASIPVHTDAVFGQTLSGMIAIINASSVLAYDTSTQQWFAEPGFNVTADQTFTEISVQWIIPAGVSLPSAIDPSTNSTFALDFLHITHDPGAYITINPIPTAVPKPSSYSILAIGLVLLGLTRLIRWHPIQS